MTFTKRRNSTYTLTLDADEARIFKLLMNDVAMKPVSLVGYRTTSLVDLQNQLWHELDQAGINSI